MRLSAKCLLTIFVCLFSSLRSVAGEDESHYLITTDDGLSNSSVNCIYQDSRGLLWMGTWDGLNVYDGGSFKTYRSNPLDDNSLLDNIVREVVQEDETHFWIVTDWGVNLLDTETDSITRFMLGATFFSSSASGGVSLVVAGDGKIICSSRGWGIAFYDRESGKMIPFNISGCSTSEITDIAGAGNGSLVLVTSDGGASLVHYGIDSGSREADAYVSEALLPEGCGVYRIDTFGDEVILFGAEAVYRYDCGAGEIVDSISFHGSVSCVAASYDRSICVVADRSQLCRIDFSSHSITRIDRLCRNNLMSFCYGTQNIVWLSIDGEGVEACCLDSDPIKKVSSRPLPDEGGGSVTSLAQTDSGDIYASVLGAGLYVIDSDEQLRRQVISGGLNDYGYIFSMIKGPGNKLFLGVRNGIEVYSPETGRSASLYSIVQNPPVVAYSLYYDEAENSLWVGTLDRGVFCLKLDDGGTGVVYAETFCHNPKDETSLGSDSVMHISSAGDDGIWIGTLGGGLNLLDVSSNTFSRISLGGEFSGIPSNNVRYVYQEDSSSIWVGTSYGISHGTRTGDGEWSFTHYDVKSGLANNTVHSILKDGEGRIWIATNGGLSMFVPATGQFLNYTKHGSLQSREFYIHSCLSAQNGELYFGGVNGINHFYPQDLYPREYSPSIILKSVTVGPDNEKIVTGSRKIVLRHDENFFNISYSALEYINNSDCSYSYRLSGFSNDWVTVPAGTPATFTNVPPGKYVFSVRSTNGDQVWCDNQEDLRITVLRPWYLTVWAFLVYVTSACLLAFFVLKYYRERKRSREQLAAEALERQNQKERYEAKLTFFTDVAHEFGTPLTLISCSGSQLASGGQSAVKSRRYIKIINDNASRMQRLIQELLEFRKIESGHSDFSFSVIDPVQMLNGILADFSALGETHRIKLNLRIENPPSRFVSDSSALEKIFINLISNAYKYTPDDGTVDIALTGKDGGIDVSITNTSAGLSEEKLARVFDRFVILDNFERQVVKGKTPRNGVGMALVKSYLTQLGGEIEVSSVMGESVTFSFYLPSGELADAAPETEALSDGVQEAVLADNPPETSETDAGNEDRDVQDELRPGAQVLVVDDDALICEMVADVLEGMCSVIKAGDGEEALSILNAERIDLVITDINMPKMRGTELIGKMKENELTRFIPVIVLAMKTDITDEIRAYNLGSETFISKPFLPAQLVAVVDNILRKRSSLKDYYASSASDRGLFFGVEMNSRDRQFIASFVSIVESRITEELSLKELADQMCVSEMTLYRRIKSVLGQTPGELIRNVRLKHAAKLLRTSTLTVQEVMFDSGFNNKSWFYRKFTEMFGMSPKEYQSGK